MNDNTSTAGTPAGESTSAAQADRFFVSVNGDLQGPFTFEQLRQRQPGSNAWVWQIGQADWKPLPATLPQFVPQAPVPNGTAGPAADITSAPRFEKPSSKPVPVARPVTNGQGSTWQKALLGAAGVIAVFVIKVMIFGPTWADVVKMWQGPDYEGNRPVPRPQPVETPAPAATQQRGLFDWAGRTAHQQSAVTPSVQPQAQPAVAPVEAVGLTRGELKLASAYVVTSWLAWPNTQHAVSGSAVPFAILADGQIVLMTNRHVLDVDALMAAKTDRGLFVGKYQIDVKFPSGRVGRVLKIRPETTNVDLALLYVDGQGLQAGVDYVIAPLLPATTALDAGDEVVAVGNPGLGGDVLESTQTFGHVSALRDYAVDGVTTKLIQTDCALNHGNSGGPLLVKVGDRHFWAGINTAAASPDKGYQGLNFAIDARQAMGLRYFEYAATPNGVTSYMDQGFHFTASTFLP